MNNVKNCLNCNKEFVPRRQTAKFCFSTCRMQYWNKNYKLHVQPKSSIHSTLRGVVEENAAKNNDAAETQKKVEVLVENPEYLTLKHQYNMLVTQLKDCTKKKQELIISLQKTPADIDNLVRLIGIGSGAVIADRTFKNPAKMFFGASMGALVTSMLLYKDREEIEAEKREYITQIQISIKENGCLLSGINQKLTEIKSKLSNTKTHITKGYTIPLVNNEEANKKVNVISSDPQQKNSTEEIPMNIKKIEVLPPVDINSSKVINSRALGLLTFKSFDFKGEWLLFLGRPSIVFFCVIFGKPGQGKSTFAITFSKYLAENFGKVLYVSAEEGISMTLKEKVIQTNALSDFLDVAELTTFDTILQTVNPDAYNFIFLDSLDKLKIGPEQMKEFREKYKDSAIIAVCQSTKDGKMRGSQEIAHDDDITVVVENGVATTSKNRFKAIGERFQVFKGTDNLKLVEPSHK